MYCLRADRCVEGPAERLTKGMLIAADLRSCVDEIYQPIGAMAEIVVVFARPKVVVGKGTRREPEVDGEL